MQRRELLAAGLAALPVLAPLPARAQTPLRIVTTDQPGGGMDALLRPLADRLGQSLGRPVLVENRAGAQGRIGGQVVATSPPDGNTLLVTVQAGVVINPQAYPSWPYNTLTDLVPVTDMGRGSLLLLTGPSMPANDFAGLAKWLQAQPRGSVSYGTYSPGTISHFGGVLLAQSLGVDMVAVHYKASGDQVRDIAGGQVALGWGPAAGSVGQLIKAGRLKAMAYLGPKRLPAFPDVPTIRELGHPSVEMDGWIGVFAPRGTPSDAVAHLQQEIARAIAAPQMRDLYLNVGFAPGGAPPAEFAQLVKSDWQRFGETIRMMDYRPE
ncbi:MAG: tripartite tricarboxylate transporter substrate binding protein [Pseudacidovorax sp.]|uniref:Bug family tripartite tricarboxylate transporter substrate binding protein n=1 Tax=Pseudacidovorax sp. TaxID=1934311 RepID=UPI001B404A99|nr:tripartite tricarboxylate transporter substrate binding protein [Pseudacidovorax sp.]MBP6897726.1 tripartite tricarboxylate transporter substrate binding protein [Pseudacidovorax sp.]